jgi:putative transposase
MAKPRRNASPDDIMQLDRTFFATTKTSMRRGLLQSERNAELLIDVLRSLARESAFTSHDFVIMPDHVHLLLTVNSDMTVEKAMQLVKGRFSFRLKKEYGVMGEVWQRGFSEVQVLGKKSFETHRVYIAENPVKAGLVESAEQYPHCYQYLANRKSEVRQGLKPA